MAEFVHQDVRTFDGSDSSSVELAVVPATGEQERLKNAVREHSGTFKEEALGMLRVSLPSNKVSEFITLDCIKSVSKADSTIGDLDEGNPNILPE